MTLHRLGLLSVAALALAACATPDTATRNMPLDLPVLQAADGSVIARNYALAGLEMAVPADLRVSESNGYYPFVDIVWRGDPIGDRREQIASMFYEAAQRNVEAPVDGQRPVIAQVTLRRFHGVTERTHYSIGGVYTIRFDLAVRDAMTGEMVEPARTVSVDLPAPGGQAALELERAGQTERVRVTDFLTLTLQQQLDL